MLVFALCLVSTVSAIAVYGDWEDSSQTISIIKGESVNFNADFISINPPMTVNAILYDAQYNLVSTFESNTIISETSYFVTYTIDSSLYATGNYKLILSGSDNVNSDSHTLSLRVNAIPDTNAPVITLLGNSIESVAIGTTYTDAWCRRRRHNS